MKRNWHHAWLVFVGLLFAAGHADAAPPENPQLLHSFCSYSSTECEIGVYPRALVRGPDGNYYGTASYGGRYGDGVIYQVNPATRTIRIVHDFDSSREGSQPFWLKLGSDGYLYGLLTWGPGVGDTTFYRLSLANNAFEKVASSRSIHNPLAEDDQGSWYWVTDENEIYRVDPDGTITLLYAFPPAPNGGGVEVNPGLVFARNGNLYGTTRFGGLYNKGTLFRMTRDGDVVILHHFDKTDGTPKAPLVIGSDRALYGTTLGSTKHPTAYYLSVFRMSADGQFMPLSVFQTTTPGSYYVSTPLVPMPDGYLYGTIGQAPGGSNYHYDEIFRISPTGEYSRLYEFTDDGHIGSGATGGLIRGFDNALYGVSQYDGRTDGGTLYRFVPPPANARKGRTP